MESKRRPQGQTEFFYGKNGSAYQAIFDANHSETRLIIENQINKAQHAGSVEKPNILLVDSKGIGYVYQNSKISDVEFFSHEGRKQLVTDILSHVDERSRFFIFNSSPQPLTGADANILNPIIIRNMEWDEASRLLQVATERKGLILECKKLDSATGAILTSLTFEPSSFDQNTLYSQLKEVMDAIVADDSTEVEVTIKVL